MPLKLALPAASHALLSMHVPRLARFGVVGLTGTLVNTGILAFLVEIGGWNHLWGALVATEVAILTNFVLNDRWTFRSRANRSPWPVRAARYNTIALGGLALSLAALALLTQQLHLHYVVANLLAIAAATIWNYTAGTRFAWAVRTVVPEHRPIAVPLPSTLSPSLPLTESQVER